MWLLFLTSTLRLELAALYPELWQRIVSRRAYIRDELNIYLHEDVRPLSDTVGYLQPYLPGKGTALVVAKPGWREAYFLPALSAVGNSALAGKHLVIGITPGDN